MCEVCAIFLLVSRFCLFLTVHHELRSMKNGTKLMAANFERKDLFIISPILFIKLKL